MGLGSFVKNAVGALGGGMSGGLLGGLGSGLMGGAFSFLDGANDYYWNRKNMDYQNDLMIQNWNMQNAYNSPAAQMQRFREAGLNPNLIYGQTNMSGSVGTPSAGGSPSAIMSNIIGREQVRNMRAQNNNLVQQNDNLEAQSVLTREQARSLRLQNNLVEKAGQFADSPGWLRSLVRTVTPREMWRNGELSVNPGDVLRGILGGYIRSVDNMPTVNTRELLNFIVPSPSLPRRGRLYNRQDRGR